MNKKNVIKKDLLRRKIQEYFGKHPTAKSVIVKADVGDSKTLWKVMKEGTSFKVVEVNTKKEEFIIESGIVVEKQASAEYAQLSTLFTKAIQNPGDHTAMSNALRAANAALPRIVDPEEKATVGNMIGFLTNQIDVTTAGGGSKIQMRGARGASTMGASQLQQSGRKISGKIVREDEDKEPKKKDDEGDKKKPATKPKKKEPVKATGKLEPTEEPDDEIGLETDADMQEPQPEQPSMKQPSSEEMVVSQNLSGQTIKSANLVQTPGGGKLSLDLVSAAAPAELEWSKSGKVVFTFNGRPYVLKRD